MASLILLSPLDLERDIGTVLADDLDGVVHAGDHVGGEPVGGDDGARARVDREMYPRVIRPSLRDDMGGDGLAPYEECELGLRRATAQGPPELVGGVQQGLRGILGDPGHVVQPVDVADPVQIAHMAAVERPVADLLGVEEIEQDDVHRTADDVVDVERRPEVDNPAGDDYQDGQVDQVHPQHDEGREHHGLAPDGLPQRKGQTCEHQGDGYEHQDVARDHRDQVAVLGLVEENHRAGEAQAYGVYADGADEAPAPVYGQEYAAHDHYDVGHELRVHLVTAVDDENAH